MPISEKQDWIKLILLLNNLKKKKVEYIQHLQKLAKEELPLMEESLREYTRNDIRYNSTNTSLYIRTESLEQLKPLADLFLDESGKKIIPTNIADSLTPRSLAFWIMDDGQQVKKGGVTLCTDSYNSEEVNILREAIKANFNVETTIHKKKSRIIDTVYERIYINKNSLEDIKPSLMEHLHSSMLYKINEEVQIKQDYSEIESDIELIDIFGEF
jgi:LAGLIDADG DNA endonuclease family